MLVLVFDATILTNFIFKNSSRSGIFFVALNLLRELSCRKDVSLYLYFDPEKYAEGVDFQRSEFPDLPLVQKVGFIGKKLCLFNNFFWEKYISESSNFLKRFCSGVGIYVLRKIIKRIVSCGVDNELLNKANFFLSPIYKIPEEIRGYSNIDAGVFLYDSTPYKFPEYYPPSRAFFLNEIKNTSKDSDVFFFDSKSAYRDFVELFPFVNEKNSHVVHLAANDKFYQDIDLNNFFRIKIKYHIPDGKKYVFSLCSLEPRKNLIRALKSFIKFVKKHDIQDMVWVLGGGDWTSFKDQIKKEIRDFDDYGKLIIYAGYIDDEDLSVLYSEAFWFVYTSQYEGFGLPPLEAMQCGCPVITSNNSSLPEVVGDAGIMIDWDSDEQHVEAYEKYYFNETLRKENSRKGLERAKLFSWKKTVDLIVEYILLNGGGRCE